jgi:hypothetical protein
MKCINCKKKIKEALWCSIECKEEFYLKQYAGSILAENLEAEYRKQRAIDRAESFRKYTEWKVKNPDKGLSDYIMGA